MIRKTLFILFGIVLPLMLLVALSALAFWTYGGQGACFLPPLFGVYFFVLLIVFEAQRRRRMPDTNGQEEIE